MAAPRQVAACQIEPAVLSRFVHVTATRGAGAKRGLLVKGGKYLETLARADVLLVDKTGTLTLGRPQITDVVALNGMPEQQVLALAASAERYSEHPLAEAVRSAANARGLALAVPEHFEAIPGQGVRAQINGGTLAVGNRRLIPSAAGLPCAAELEAHGKILLFVAQGAELVGVLAAADTMRPEIADALAAVRALGVRQVLMLTGDNERTAPPWPSS